MSLLEIYWRALRLSRRRQEAGSLDLRRERRLSPSSRSPSRSCSAASSTPSPTRRTSCRRWLFGPASAPSTSSPSCWSPAAPTGLRTPGVPACCATPSSASSPCRCPGTTSAARPTRCTRCCALSRRCFSLWLEFMRQHLSTAVALMLLVPTAMSLDLRMSMVLVVLGVALRRDRPPGHAQDQGRPGKPSSATITRSSPM